MRTLAALLLIAVAVIAIHTIVNSFDDNNTDQRN
ncbi:MAG: hypothetical protein ACJAYB_000078 [Psychromonas sp.]|jgi:hypothetical protein